MSSIFVTCDLLDNYPDLDIQVLIPSLDGKFFQSYGGRKSFYGQIVTVKCFEDNSRVKELLATDGTGKVLVVDGGASMRCALMGDMIAESAVKNHCCFEGTGAWFSKCYPKYQQEAYEYYYG